jgi:predicted NAD-dependent protein-ADP-ribosyltransferase YbiA (DUF1768 family)
MGCILNYKGKEYSPEQLKEYLIKNASPVELTEITALLKQDRVSGNYNSLVDEVDEAAEARLGMKGWGPKTEASYIKYEKASDKDIQEAYKNTPKKAKADLAALKYIAKERGIELVPETPVAKKVVEKDVKKDVKSSDKEIKIKKLESENEKLSKEVEELKEEAKEIEESIEKVETQTLTNKAEQEKIKKDKAAKIVKEAKEKEEAAKKKQQEEVVKVEQEIDESDLTVEEKEVVKSATVKDGVVVSDEVADEIKSKSSGKVRSFIDKIRSKLKAILISFAIGSSVFGLYNGGIDVIAPVAASATNMVNYKLQSSGVISSDEVKLVEKEYRPVLAKKDTEELNKVDEFLQVIGATPDQTDKYNPFGSKKDSLMSYRSQWDNDKGFTYIATPNKKGRGGGAIKQGREHVYENVLGVGHFLIDTDIYGNNATLNVDIALNSDDYFPVFTKVKTLPDGNGEVVKLNYVKGKDVKKDSNTFTPTSLLQWKVSDIEWDKSKHGKWGKSAREARTKDGKSTSFLYTPGMEDALSRFSGNAVVFIFEKDGKTIVRDFAGSFNAILAEIGHIKSEYGITDSELTIGRYDAGSFSAKPKASVDGTISTKRWNSYNPEDGGTALLIPTDKNTNTNTDPNEAGSSEAVAIALLLGAALSKRKSNKKLSSEEQKAIDLFESDDLLAQLKTDLSKVVSKIKSIEKKIESNKAKIEGLKNPSPKPLIDSVKENKEAFEETYPVLSQMDIDKVVLRNVYESYEGEGVSYMVLLEGDNVAYLKLEGGVTEEISKDEFFKKDDSFQAIPKDEGNDILDFWKENVSKLNDSVTAIKQKRADEYTQSEKEFMGLRPVDSKVGNVKVVSYDKLFGQASVTVDNGYKTETMDFNSLDEYASKNHYSEKGFDVAELDGVGTIKSGGTLVEVDFNTGVYEVITGETGNELESFIKEKSIVERETEEGFDGSGLNATNVGENIEEDTSLLEKKTVEKTDQEILNEIEKYQNNAGVTIKLDSKIGETNAKEDGDGDEDWLPTFEDTIFDHVDTALKDRYIIRNLNDSQTKSLVNYLVYDINKTVIERDKKGLPKVSINQLMSAYKAAFLGKLIDSKKKGNDASKKSFNKILDNWSSVEEHVGMGLKRIKTINMDIDTEMRKLDKAGSDNEKKSFADGAVYEVDSKKTISAKLKLELSSIEDLETVDGKTTQARGWLNLPLTVPFDTVYNTLSEKLAGNEPNYQKLIDILKAESENIPFFKAVIKKLNKADSDVKAEFTVAMTKSYVDMRQVVWSVDDAGNYTVDVFASNAYTVAKTIQRAWANDVQNELFKVDPTDENEYIIEEKVANYLINSYEELTKGVSKNKLPTAEDMRDWLTEVGIEVEDKTWEALTTEGLYYAKKQKVWKNFFAKGGLFTNIKDSLKRHLPVNGVYLKASDSDLTSNSAIKALSTLEARFSPNYSSNSFRNGENKTVSSYTQTKLLINRLRDLIKKDEVSELSQKASDESEESGGDALPIENELRKLLGMLAFSKHSSWLKKLNSEDSAFKEIFKVFPFDSLKEGDRRGKTAGDMSPVEQELYRIGLFQNRGHMTNVKERVINVLFPTTSDKKVPHAMSVIAHNVKLQTSGEVNKPTLDAVFNSVVLPEIERILQWQDNKGKFDIKSYEDGAGAFLFLPELNTIPGLFDENGDLDRTILTELGKDKLTLIKDKVNDYINTSVANKLDEWSSLGITDKKFMDASYMKNVANGSLQFAAADFVVNSMIANSEFFQLFIGDPAVFYKGKALKSITKDGVLMRDDSAETKDAYLKAAKDTFANIGKRLAGDIAPGHELAKVNKDDPTTFKTMFLEDRESMSNSFAYYVKVLDKDDYNPKYVTKDDIKKHYPLAFEYAFIEGTDAQEYTTLAEHLFVMKGLGKIKQSKYNELIQRIEKEGDKLVLTEEEITEVLQPMKPVYVDNTVVYIKNSDGASVPAVDTRTYIKSSSFPLIPQFTKGLELDKLRNFMEKNEIDRAAYGSAAKLGQTKKSVALWGADGSINIDESALASTRILNRSGFRIQQDVPFKESKKEISDGTQQRTLLFSNLLDVGGFKFKRGNKVFFTKQYNQELLDKKAELEKRLDDVIKNEKNLSKYELFPGVMANEGQKEALDKLDTFLSDKDEKNKVFTLTGRGGTGKTTIIKKATDGKRAGFAAPSHKAKNVLSDASGQYATTVASLLGMKPVMKDKVQVFEVDTYAKSTIGLYDVLVIDEVSMIPDTLVKLIVEKSKPTAKIIFMGDNVQLPPIEQDQDSIAFKQPGAKLTERMRQDETSPILPITDNLANAVENNGERKSIKDRVGYFNEEANEGTLFLNDKDEALTKAAEDFLTNPTKTKVITYNNETNSSANSVKNLNPVIRKKINEAKGLDNSVDYHIGEQLTAYETIAESSEGLGNGLQNSSDYTVIATGDISTTTTNVKRGAHSTGSFSVEQQEVTLKDNISGEEITREIPTRLGAQQIKDKIEEVRKNNKWALKYAIIESFPSIEYGYAITTYKSQGSTYRNVYVMEANITKETIVKDKITVSDKAVNQHLYVATSRASHKLVMLSSLNKSGNKKLNKVRGEDKEVKQRSKPINIYFSAEENAELSNFDKRPFEVNFGVFYDNVESAFQAAKLDYAPVNENNLKLISKFEKSTGPEAKALGGKITGLDTVKWDKDSSEIMKNLISQSFYQNPKALEALLATGNAPLTHTQDKGKWGKEFPKLLMEVRRELGGEQYSEQSGEQTDTTGDTKQSLIDELSELEQEIQNTATETSEVIEQSDEMDGFALREEFENAYKELFEFNKNAFDKKFYTKNGKLKLRMLQEALLQEAESQGYPKNDILGLQLNKEGTGFVLPLWSSSSASKFESLINGIIDKGVVKQKVRGNSFVLGSEEGTKPVREWEELTSSQRNDIILHSDFDPKTGLKPQRTIDGVVYPAEIMISNKFKDDKGNPVDLTKFVVDGMINTELLPDNMLEMFAYRIPTQGLNSMSYVKVVGILPDVMGDLLIAPRDWTKQMGSDFDIDKVYMTMFNTKIENGILVKNELGKAAIENKILDIHMSVLKNPADEVQQQVLAPLGFGWLKEGGDPGGINEERRNMGETIAGLREAPFFNPLAPTYQKDLYVTGQAGKTGIGVFSLDSTLNASMQGRDIRFSDLNVRFGDIVSDGDLSNPYTLRDRKDPAKRRTKSDVIAAYQSAAVDNAVEQLLDKLNVNNNTYDAIRVLNQLGFEEDIVTLFINQPGVIYYTNKLKSLSDSTSDFKGNVEEEALRLTRVKYNITKKDDVIEKDADVGYDKLKEAIKENKDSVQMAMVDKFINLSDYGKQLKAVQSATNTASSGLSNSTFENIVKEDRVKGLYTNSIVNVNSLVGEYYERNERDSVPMGKLTTSKGDISLYIKPTTIAGFASTWGLTTANDILTKFFPYREPSVKAIIDEVMEDLPEQESIGKEAELKKKIFKNIKMSFNTLVSAEPTEDRMALFIDTEERTSLASKFKAIQKLPMLLDNAFVQRLEPVINKGNKPSYVRFNAGTAVNSSEDDIYSGFIDLASKQDVLIEATETEDVYTTRDLANDLVTAALLEGGVQEASQYVRYIPMSYLLKGDFHNKMKDLDFKNISMFGTDSKAKIPSTMFKTQYFQHNPNQATVMDKKDFKMSRGVLSFTKTGFSKHVKMEKESFIFPNFVSLRDNSKLKKFRLFQLQGEGYIEIPVTGTYGMNSEYDLNSFIDTILSANPINKSIPVSETPLDAYVDLGTGIDIDMYGSGYNAPIDFLPEDYLSHNLHGKTPQEAFSEIATMGSGDTKIVAEYLKDVPVEFKIDTSQPVSFFENKNFDSEGNRLGPASISGKAVYAPDGNTVYVNTNKIRSNEEMQRVFTHEATHVLTIQIVKDSLEKQDGRTDKLSNLITIFENEMKANKGAKFKAQTPIVQQMLTYMFDGKNKSELKRLQEFTAFAMSEPEIQRLLKETPYRESKDTWWDKLKAVFTDMIEKTFGDGDNLFAAAMGETISLIESNATKTETKVEPETETENEIETEDITTTTSELPPGFVKGDKDDTSDLFDDLPNFADEFASKIYKSVKQGLVSPEIAKETANKLKNC